ncbi:MAG: DUF5060 domain-containing protein [Chloroflexota bacterium]
MSAVTGAGGAYRIWEKIELTLLAQKAYANPYTDVVVWVDLDGPGFHKRVYGFWDGGAVHRVRILATAPGEWSWVSGSNQDDAGLNGRSGRFVAVGWTDAEKDANPLAPRPLARHAQRPRHPARRRRALLSHRRHLVVAGHPPLSLV